MMFNLLSALAVSALTTSVSAAYTFGGTFNGQIGINGTKYDNNYLTNCTTGDTVSVCALSNLNDPYLGFAWFYSSTAGASQLGYVAFYDDTVTNPFPLNVTFTDVPGQNYNTKAVVLTQNPSPPTLGIQSIPNGPAFFVPGTDPKTKKPVDLFRWYICETVWAGKTFNTLNFLPQGQTIPNNPTCVSVTVYGYFP